MKLYEIANPQSNTGGHWEVETIGGVRHWTPNFSPTKKGLLPFEPARFQKNPKLYAVSAYNLLPGKRSLRKLPQKEKQLFTGLLDALKLRSEKDVIEPRVFSELLDRSATSVISKAKLRNQSPNRFIIVTPGSSSKVAEQFAITIQHKLGVPDEHVFLGHFDKRDIDDYVLDVLDSEKLPDVTKQQIMNRLQGFDDAEPGTKIQAKFLRQGDREDARSKADIHMLDVTKDIKLPQKVVPYLLIVDDNTQRGTTYKSVAELFKRHTGTEPGVAINLSMFKI